MRQRPIATMAQARSTVEELLAFPPVNEAELVQRLAAVDAACARRALLERLDGGLPREDNFQLLAALFGHLGVGEARSGLADIIASRGDDPSLQSLAVAVLAAASPEHLMPALRTLPVEQALHLLQAPMVEQISSIKADPELAETITAVLECAPQWWRAQMLEHIESCRRQAATSAAATYRHALARDSLACVRSALIAAVAAEGGADGIAVLEELRSNSGDPRLRDELQAALARMRTRRIDPRRRVEPPPAGFAFIGSCDGQGAYVLIGCIQNPDGSLTMADLCIRAAAGVRDGFVVPRYTRKEVDQFMHEVRHGTGLEFAPLSLVEAAELVADAVERTRALGLSVPPDAQAPVALFKAVLEGGRSGSTVVQPAGPASLERMRQLLRRREYRASWFFDTGDLLGAGVELPRGGRAGARWIETAAAKLDTPPVRRRLVSMARHMARWHALRDEMDLAGLCAAAAEGVEKDFRGNSLTTAMLDHSIEVLTGVGAAEMETKAGDTRMTGDPALRQHLRSVFFANVTSPRGRDLAQLDLTEVALRSVDRAADLLPGERRPREDERYEIACVIGTACAKAITRGGFGPIERWVENTGVSMSRVCQLTARECEAMVVAALPTVMGFVSEACSTCPVDCFSRPRAPMAEAFFSPRHPLHQ